MWENCGKSGSIYAEISFKLPIASHTCGKTRGLNPLVITQKRTLRSMDLNSEVFMRLMTTSLPVGINELDRVIDDRFLKARECKAGVYEVLNFEHGGHILTAVRSALVTLSNTVHTDAKGNKQVRVTSTGVAGLLRIAFEGLANFRWLSDPDEPIELEARAFGVHFTQVYEAQKYYRDLGDTKALTKFTKLLNFEIEYGKTAGFLEEKLEKPGSYKCVGLANIPDTTSLCRVIKVPESIVTDEVKAIYTGMRNGSFLYRWLSGNTHGMFWVNGFEEASDGKMTPKIPYLILNLALETSLAEIRVLAQQL